ncbi:MAG: glycoside hydrolase family 28 protein [Opitutaceae bacterium]|nr:glycoside hydrolase family 28 protein [Opitutaceae bacterium]
MVVRLSLRMIGALIAALVIVLPGDPALRASDLDTHMQPTGLFNVRDHGAVGDGLALDTDAINRAVAAAAEAGGGTVVFPAGTYLTFSIRLRSRVTLHLGAGATLLAADPAEHAGRYDAPEKPDNDLYQDFGHSHFQNSLVWGIDLEDVGITGPGRIHGKGLTRRGPGAAWKKRAGEIPLSMVQETPGNRPVRTREEQVAAMDGLGNKAIALKRCRNVVLRDFSVLMGGHFALLATGVDNLTIDHVTVDTNRDGFDIDGCRHVRISNCAVNSPNDDAIVLKSSFALGELRPTENVAIVNCSVSGFNAGSLLDGTRLRTQERAPDRDGVTGRIKIGTESNGAFRNITIANCTFERSRGLAFETVDGATIEDVTVTNLVMREITTAPIFLRLGDRARGPEGTPVGAIRRVIISMITVYDAESRFASILSGLPGHPIEEVTLSNIRIVHRGGGTAEDAARRPAENPDSYPEPSMFGTIPAHGLFVRHVRGLVVRHLDVTAMAPDARPAVVLDDVVGVRFDGLRATGASGSLFELREASDFAARACGSLPDTVIARVEGKSL